MSDRDEELARLYRALAKEEPPETLDAAILAASRRAVVRPSLARRWAGPVSVAAVLVLAIGVTLEMRDEAPGIEAPATSPPALERPRGEPAAPEAKREEPVPEARRREERREIAPARPAPRAVAPQPAPPARAESNVAPAPAAPSASSPAPAPAAPAASKIVPMQARPSRTTLGVPEEKRLSAPATASSAPAAADLATRSSPDRADDPAALLEAIAKLRAAGEDAEADRALEDFRRRYPGYRIDAATWERVRPR
jgi:hypothetical protein